MKKKWTLDLIEVLKIFTYFVLVVVLVFAAYKLVILRAPAEKLELPGNAEPGILDKLGSQTAVAVVIVMVVLVAWVFYLFIQFGRRLTERGYLGPLMRDALARAEITREVDNLKEDLKKGVFAAEIDVRSDEFRRRFGIPEGVEPPPLTPGVDIDEYGRGSYYSGYSTGGGYPHGWGTSPGDYDYDVEDNPWFYKKDTADTLAEKMQQARKESKSQRIQVIENVIAERFEVGYREMQLEVYRCHRQDVSEKAREHASAMLPRIDVSTFGGGWIFVLEFTTIIFIVFATLALGFVDVLKGEQIGTILAAIAGYVLGKSTTIRGGGGQEIVRGAEEPKALIEAITKQAELRYMYDEDQVKLLRQVEELQNQLAKTKTIVPEVIGLDGPEAEKQVRGKGLIAVVTEVATTGAAEGKVFQQVPMAPNDAERGTTVMLLVARKPDALKEPQEPKDLIESQEPKEPKETDEPQAPKA